MAQQELSDKEIQHLIKIATQPKLKKGDKAYLKEVRDFCEAKGVVPGTQPITPYQVYDLYKQWADVPMELTLFCTKLKMIFQPKKYADSRVYMLNPSPFDLSIEYRFKLRRKYHAEKEERKENKKARQGNKTKQG